MQQVKTANTWPTDPYSLFAQSRATKRVSNKPSTTLQGEVVAELFSTRKRRGQQTNLTEPFLLSLRLRANHRLKSTRTWAIELNGIDAAAENAHATDHFIASILKHPGEPRPELLKHNSMGKFTHFLRSLRVIARDHCQRRSLSDGNGLTHTVSRRREYYSDFRFGNRSASTTTSTPGATTKFLLLPRLSRCHHWEAAETRKKTYSKTITCNVSQVLFLLGW